ncbi:Protein artemis [Beauveria bassiana]|nr:Protein artemis [Beauveria bassiana]
MSTFAGLVPEFPEIKRQAPPLACFLSHIHSDHLAGLDTLRSPFVYCSAATREILLRLERYPCRINYVKGVLEARQQTYKHLSTLLRPIPLETPTTLELAPSLEMQVTLFDANHCPGAVMFLIERNDTAILYTGDLRSEPWFVNSIVRHPTLIEYTSGIRRLDKIYLDTSFTKNIPFQTKQEGIAELLRKVASYPPDTVFYFQTWTYGYEEVWLALSKALKSPIHVDEYKMRIYTSLSSKIGDHRFASLTGYMCGNAWHPGCLTTDESARLHSCEKGNLCSVASRPNVVKIQPIVAHLANGTDIAEAGVGGGGNDFQRDAELGSLSPQDFRALQELIKRTGKGHDGFLESLAQKMASGRDMPLGLAMNQFGEHLTASIEKLSGMPSPPERTDSSANTTLPASQAGLPRVVRFPYARHSSYEELCHFVDAFKPRDVWPCTENAQQWWRKGYSIASYFGEFCSGNVFAYDRMVKETYPEPPPPQEDEDEDEDAHDTQTTGRVSVVAFGEEEAPLSSPVKTCLLSESRGRDDVEDDDDDDRPDSTPKRARRADDTAGQDESQQHSVASHMTETDSAVRWEAYTRTLARLHDDDDDDDDDDGGSLSLLSTTDHHSKVEQEL